MEHAVSEGLGVSRAFVSGNESNGCYSSGHLFLVRELLRDAAVTLSIQGAD